VRDLKTYFKDITKKPPLLFPLVALYHLFLLGYTIWLLHDAPFPGTEWLMMAVILLFSVFWFLVCDMRKVGALGYLALTSVNLIIMFGLKSFISKDVYTNSLFPTDVLFSFFVLFYYRTFE
jgi:hypothetical protein